MLLLVYVEDKDFMAIFVNAYDLDITISVNFCLQSEVRNEMNDHLKVHYTDEIVDGVPDAVNVDLKGLLLFKHQARD